MAYLIIELPEGTVTPQDEPLFATSSKEHLDEFLSQVPLWARRLEGDVNQDGVTVAWFYRVIGGWRPEAINAFLESIRSQLPEGGVSKGVAVDLSNWEMFHRVFPGEGESAWNYC